MKNIGLAVLFVFILASSVFAVDEKAIVERIAQLEAQKTQIEQAYIGLMARIEELGNLLTAGKDEAKAQENKEKNGE